MAIIRKVIPVIALSLIMSACASTSQQTYSSTQTKKQAEELSPNISFAPAIDISYAEVLTNIDQNIGVDIRWGGKVIESTKVNDSTVRLTVFAYPLSSEGRPLKKQQAGNESGRFIVDLPEGLAQDKDFKEHFVTFYGDVTSRLVITNGNRKKEIPIIHAQELVDWNIIDESRVYTSKRRSNSYYGSGYRNGYFGYGSRLYFPYYGGISFGYRSRHSSHGFFGGHRSFKKRSYGGHSFKRHYKRHYKRH